MADNDTQTIKEKPVVYIFHGDDQLAIQQHLEKMKESLEDEGILETNLTQFDCRFASDEDIHAAAMSLPFLAPRRIVILTNPLTKLDAKEDQDDEATRESRRRFLAMLDRLPPTTALVLVIHDHSLGKKGWAILKRNQWLMKWVSSAGKRAHYQPCRLPDKDKMPAWIQKEAKAYVRAFIEDISAKHSPLIDKYARAHEHKPFTPDAAEILAALVGNDTLTAYQEIGKLLTYVDMQRPVEKEDVEQLCSGDQGNIFNLVDAIGKKDKHTALRELHQLLEREDGQGLFFMTVRQFRMLIQVRDHIDNGGTLEKGSSEVRRIPSFLLGRLNEQARCFSMAQLEMIYHQLLEMDEAIKKSQLTPELALDTLIAEIDK